MLSILVIFKPNDLGSSVIIVSLGRLITVLKSSEALDKDITCMFKPKSDTNTTVQLTCLFFQTRACR